MDIASLSNEDLNQVTGGKEDTVDCPYGLSCTDSRYCPVCSFKTRVGGYEEYGQSMYKCTLGIEGVIPMSPCSGTDCPGIGPD